MKLKPIIRAVTLVSVMAVLFSISLHAKEPQFQVDNRDQFDSYWYKNTAEITHYRLEQVRYGEVRDGRAVLIYVTEPMNGKRQVKADPPYDGKDIIPVLKLNLTKKFNTGIYPYSLMTSVFSPVDSELVRFPEKITMTAQEWCGQVFAQMNLKWNGYRSRIFSYFEQESDQSFTLKKAIPEDGIWNMIRLGPENLPTGDITIIPSIEYTRFSHTDLEPVEAETELRDAGDGLLVYSLSFPAQKRTLSITFEKEFPHRIEGWEETAPGSRDNDAAILTTRAMAEKRILSDYWRRNSNADLYLREELGLP